MRSDSHTAVVRDNTVCDNFVDNLVILINLFPWIGTVEQPIEVQTNLVLCNIAYIAYKFSTPVIKNELIILSIQSGMKAATRVQNLSSSAPSFMYFKPVLARFGKALIGCNIACVRSS